MNFKHRLLYICIFNSVVLSGCGASDRVIGVPEVNQYIEQVKAEPPAQITERKFIDASKISVVLSDLKIIESPFGVSKAITAIQNQAKITQIEINRPRGPLEEQDLNVYRMVGTLERNKKIWALIRDPQGRIYILGVGEYIGKNSGRVQKISDSSIIVKELVSIGLSGRQEQTVSIFLEGVDSNATQYQPPSFALPPPAAAPAQPPAAPAPASATSTVSPTTATAPAAVPPEGSTSPTPEPTASEPTASEPTAPAQHPPPGTTVVPPEI